MAQLLSSIHNEIDTVVLKMVIENIGKAHFDMYCLI